MARAAMGLAALILVLIAGGFLVYLRPIGSTPQLASIEDCIYTTSSTVGGMRESGIAYTGTLSTSIGSYSTTATVKMTTGAVTTSTTTITPIPRESNSGFPPSGVNSTTSVFVEVTYLETDTMTCTYVK